MPSLEVGEDGWVAQDLEEALSGLRPLLLDVGGLVRAVAAGRRRGEHPEVQRVELRPVQLKAGRRLQVVTTDGRTPTTRNHDPARVAATVDALLAQPFGNWHVETADRVVQLRVTKSGQAQVHTARTSRRGVEPAASTHDRVKPRLLDPADPLFAALGAGADKRRQVDAFLRQLSVVAPRALTAARSAGRPLRVVDLGCGNAYLTFAAHRWLSQQAVTGASAGVVPAGGGSVPDRLEVRTLGVDVRPELVARNTLLAQRLAMPGLTFAAGTIADAEPDFGDPATGPGTVDLVLALHACDTTTDEALARAVRWHAEVVLAAPCCHHDVQRQLDAGRQEGRRPPRPYAALLRHGILKERFADVLTDALRADLLRLLGYRVEVVEFVDSRHTPRNALLRARRTGTRADAACREEYRDLVCEWGLRPALARLLRAEVDAVLAGTAGPVG
jgi:SAM-dependent methyltransferase